ncbi:MAG TPA: HAMP domain-containing protein, partial [Rhodobacteraceae bacterium]|nr:HAMP domain-containing protein [Paracoccaceae bacterium]
MTFASRIDVGKSETTKGADIVLGDDWIAPHTTSESEVRARRARRGLISINRSPLARKIVTFNLLALIILVAGVLYLNPFRDSLVYQWENGLIIEAELVADVMEAQLAAVGKSDLKADGLPDVAATLAGLDLRPGSEVYVFTPEGELLAKATGIERENVDSIVGLPQKDRSTFITDFLNAMWEGISSVLAPSQESRAEYDPEAYARQVMPEALSGATRVNISRGNAGGAVFSVATPIMSAGKPVGAITVLSAAGEIDQLVRNEREQVLQMFLIAILVSIGLSLVLASTVANPLSDLAAAAEVGRDNNSRKVGPGRVRIPDLSGRPDEIGRLSSALRGMVAALYERIDANEQFAADVAHEIKNPLASLRSAVGTLRVAKREDQRDRLLNVIEHDVRRLDRLVSDISNASRLDSELVKEEEETFDLLKMLTNITNYLGEEAHSKGIEFITDMPKTPIQIQ